MEDRIDVLVVGGGPAGLASALTLLRAEKRVVLADAGTPRNARAAHVHGYPTRDGATPSELREAGLAELLRYPRFAHRAQRVDEIGRRGASLLARLGDGSTIEARRIVLATGLVDVLPKIPGLQEHWGRSIFDCPYCHGHELASEPWGVFNVKVGGVLGAIAYTTWTRDLVLFTHGQTQIEPQARRDLERAKIRVETRTITRFHGDEVLTGIELEGGEIVPRRALVLAPQTRPSDLPLMMGLAVTPEGLLRIDPATRETSMKGVVAVGDLAGAGLRALTSAADGMRAGQSLAHALTFEDALGW